MCYLASEGGKGRIGGEEGRREGRGGGAKVWGEVGREVGRSGRGRSDEREAGRGNLWLWWFVTRVDIYFMHLVIAEILIIQSTLCGFSCHFLGERSEREPRNIWTFTFCFFFSLSYTTFCSDDSLVFNSGGIFDDKDEVPAGEEPV